MNQITYPHRSSACNFPHHMTRIPIPTFFLQFLPKRTIKYLNWHGILLTCHDFLLKIQKTMHSLWEQFTHFISILFIETKQNFDRNLCNHWLARMFGCEFNSSNDHSFTDEDHAYSLQPWSHLQAQDSKDQLHDIWLAMGTGLDQSRNRTSRYNGTCMWRCILQRISSLLVCSCHRNFSCRCLSHWRKINDGWALQDGFLMGSLVRSRWVSLRWMEGLMASSNWLFWQWRRAGIWLSGPKWNYLSCSSYSGIRPWPHWQPSIRLPCLPPRRWIPRGVEVLLCELCTSSFLSITCSVKKHFFF